MDSPTASRGRTEELVQVNGIELCIESFGDRRDPAILLIGGAGSSMDWWEVGFCERLVAGSRFVIRYDSRDTGRSTSYPAGAPAYAAPDLIADALGVLDVFDLVEAHLIGISMGGALAQRLAVEHPDRIASLTLMSTSPDGPGGPDSPELPPSNDALRALFADPPPEPDWSDRTAVVDYLVASERAISGSLPFDEAHVRELVGRVVDRTTNMAASLANHMIIDGSDPPRPRFGEVMVPTLVLHGTEDPLFPLAHAQALANEIHGAELIPLEGLGHQMPPAALWNVVIPAILRCTSGGWDAQADRLAAKSLAAGDPSGWFERLYHTATVGEVAMPWDREQPNLLLARWAQDRRLNGNGRRAVVVGCGLGADAEYVAGLGFTTVAFDVSDTAVQVARDRSPGSAVAYEQADLLDLPDRWTAAFDLVVEIFTVQALPRSHRRQAVDSVARLVAPGGTLLVIAAVRDEPNTTDQGPPWPLTRSEMDSFGTGVLKPVDVEVVTHPDQPTARR